MNIEAIEEFVYLAESLSFTKTAQRFYVSRSAVSRHISALEKEVGVCLVERDQRSVHVTKEGRAFYREAKVLIRDFERMLLSTRGAFDDDERAIRVAYLRNATRAYNVQFARQLQAAAPYVRPSFVPMDHDEMLRALDEHVVDLALGMEFGQDLPAGVRTAVLCRDQLMAVMCDTSPLCQGKRPVPVEELVRGEILVSQSFAEPVLGDFLEDRLGQGRHRLMLSYCKDLDAMRLRMQVENKATLQSMGNAAVFCDDFATRRVEGADLSFYVSAFLPDRADDDLARAVDSIAARYDNHVE
ncbi:MAG: LysR family transcriptional regulator [Coriobacteriia bacterium]|nr:LysR family transcriptional regulator [Coriobacteriia bacterium]